MKISASKVALLCLAGQTAGATQVCQGYLNTRPEFTGQYTVQIHRNSAQLTFNGVTHTLSNCQREVQDTVCQEKSYPTFAVAWGDQPESGVGIAIFFDETFKVGLGGLTNCTYKSEPADAGGA